MDNDYLAVEERSELLKSQGGKLARRAEEFFGRLRGYAERQWNLRQRFDGLAEMDFGLLKGEISYRTLRGWYNSVMREARG